LSKGGFRSQHRYLADFDELADGSYRMALHTLRDLGSGVPVRSGLRHGT